MGTCVARDQGIIILTVSQWAGARRITSASGRIQCAGGRGQAVNVLCYDETMVELQQISETDPGPELGAPSGEETSDELTCEIMARLHEMALQEKPPGPPPEIAGI